MWISGAFVATLIVAANADYTSFFFSANNTCPGLGIACDAPDSLCAYDSVVDKHYCCSGANYNICRAFAATCGGRNNGPSSAQQECNTDGTTWCCLGDSERCTQRTGQTNVCVATQANPIASVPKALMEDTFSSLSSAKPRASTLSVDAVSLASRATATSSSSSTTSSTSSPATATSSASNTSSDSISGGAIAGAVVGGVAGIAAIIALVWFILRRRRNRGNKGVLPTSSYQDKGDKSGTRSPEYTQVGSPAPQYQTAEVEGSHGWSEVPGEGNGLLSGVKEMPDTSIRSEVRELPG